jgi:hypothetical protein
MTEDIFDAQEGFDGQAADDFVKESITKPKSPPGKKPEEEYGKWVKLYCRPFANMELMDSLSDAEVATYVRLLCYAKEREAGDNWVLPRPTTFARSFPKVNAKEMTRRYEKLAASGFLDLLEDERYTIADFDEKALTNPATIRKRRERARAKAMLAA